MPDKIANKKNKIGFTVIEALVGVCLMSIVFSGIMGAYRLGMKVIGLSKNKITASAIATARMETIRALPYDQAGVKNAVLPDVSGDIDPVATQISNGTLYTIVTEVEYVADPSDGMGEDDSCNLDYKKVRVNVSWEGNFPGAVEFATNISPENQVQELQSCQSQPGGVLSVLVSDSHGVLISSPLIEIYQMPALSLVETAAPSNGEYSFLLSPGTYRIAVSKEGYNSVRTYDSAEVAVPNDPDLAVFEGAETKKSLFIDMTAGISIDGISPFGQENFSDNFDDQTKISSLNGTEILGGAISLAGPVPYEIYGEAVSSEIAPADLVAWDNFMFNDNCPPGTDIIYQIMGFNGTEWLLVPDDYIGQNSAGLTGSPIQLGAVPAGEYPKLEIKATFSTNDSESSPRAENWQISWVSSAGAPVGGAAFHIQGEKTIGKDASGNNVYRTSQDLALDGAGHLDLLAAESDLYTFSVDEGQGFSLIGTQPAIQPIDASPGSSIQINLYLSSQNSLLVTVQNEESFAPVFAAQIRLYSAALGYDKTQQTDQKGQTYFAPLQNGTYDYQIEALGYDNYSGTVSVSGSSVQTVNIHQNE